MNEMIVLCLNLGATSLKCALYRFGDDPDAGGGPGGAGPTLLVRGAVEHIGQPEGLLWLADAAGTPLMQVPGDYPHRNRAVRAIFDAVEIGHPAPTVVGHRLSHGGLVHTQPAIVDDALRADLREVVCFAPAQLTAEIAAIDAVATRWPGVTQVACFDTAFHQRTPSLAHHLALPGALWDAGVRRYGSHGLSHEYICEQLPPDAGRTVIAHLGEGSSLAAVNNGEPVDSTAGCTPTAGPMMGTRGGDIDPGLLVHLVRERYYNSKQLEQLVYRQSGLLGVSGLSSDMAVLLRARGSDPAAALAVDLYCYRLRQHIAGLTASLGGLDTLVFTGGIGEGSAAIREQTCAGLEYLGVAVDRYRNAENAERISTDVGRCVVRVIPTDEALVIARQAHARMRRASGFPAVRD